MNWTHIAVSAALLGGILWLVPDDRSAQDEALVTTQVVDYVAQCFVDTATERRWCEKRSEFARLVDCTDAKSKLKCRTEYMSSMGQAGWRLVRIGGGVYEQWYDAPLFFYERVTLHQAKAP